MYSVHAIQRSYEDILTEYPTDMSFENMLPLTNSNSVILINLLKNFFKRRVSPNYF